MRAGDESDGSAGWLGPRCTAVTLVALSLLILAQAFQIRQGGGYSAIGPRFFPVLVGSGLLLLSGIFLLRTTLKPDADLLEQAASEEAATHWPTVGLLALALVVYAAVLSPLGYILATALFFPMVARILGSTRPWRDLIIGIAIGVVIYVGFTRALGVRLPAGLLGGIL